MALSFGIQPLPIEKALELYDILGEYLPDFSEDDTVLDFVGKIVNNTVEDQSTAIIDALCLMTNMDVKEILDFSSEIKLKMFITGLTMNDVVSLNRFCKDIRYDR